MTKLHTAKLQALAALALSIAAGAAMADDITIDTQPYVSTKTRAEVAQELAQFKKGSNPWSTSYNVGAATITTHTRAEVLDDLAAARRTGELGAMAAEDSGSSYLAQTRRATVAPVHLASR